MNALLLIGVALQTAEEDNTKKRKIIVEIDKKQPELKRPPSREKKEPPAPTRITRPSPAPSSSQAVKTTTYTKSAIKTTAQSSAIATPSHASTIKLVTSSETKPIAKPAPVSSSKAKGKAPAAPADADADSQPSKVVQAQMTARMKAQAQAVASQAPEHASPIPSELIELPEPNSEYSDSEDESRPRYAAPGWAQSPELAQALQSQATVNPDDIFGAIRPLRMEDIFRSRQSRFRARTSSANWSGADRLTEEEDREYARRMGFR